MSFFERHLLPRAIDWACGSAAITELRQELVPQARGQVLEVGMGPGLNLPHYQAGQVEKVWGLEPSAGMERRARSRLDQAPVEVEWLACGAEAIPLDDASMDTILLTFTLCSIPEWERALAEMHRVLRPGGQLLFCEHGMAPDNRVCRWQNRLNPLWHRLSGGCNINRPMDQMLRQAGFDFQRLDTGYLPGTPRIAGYLYRGMAVR